MAVVNREETAARPLLRLSEFGLDDVQNYRDPILIVRANHACVRVRSVCNHHSILFLCVLCWVVDIFEALDLISFHLDVFCFLSRSHFHAAIVDNLDIVCLNEHHSWTCAHAVNSGCWVV